MAGRSETRLFHAFSDGDGGERPGDLFDGEADDGDGRVASELGHGPGEAVAVAVEVGVGGLGGVAKRDNFGLFSGATEKLFGLVTFGVLKLV